MFDKQRKLNLITIFRKWEYNHFSRENTAIKSFFHGERWLGRKGALFRVGDRNSAKYKTGRYSPIPVKIRG